LLVSACLSFNAILCMNGEPTETEPEYKDYEIDEVVDGECPCDSSSLSNSSSICIFAVGGSIAWRSHGRTSDA
jgi:hypothetical protein